MNGHRLLKERGLLARYRIDERVIPMRKQRRAVVRYLNLLDRKVDIDALQKKALNQLNRSYSKVGWYRKLATNLSFVAVLAVLQGEFSQADELLSSPLDRQLSVQTRDYVRAETAEETSAKFQTIQSLHLLANQNVDEPYQRALATLNDEEFFVADNAILTVIDPGLDQWELLADAVEAGEILLLKPDQPPLEQIIAKVRSMGQVKVLNILSHGNDGEIHLAGQSISARNLVEHKQQLHELGALLTEDGQLQLFGCDVAKSELGKSFVTELAQITGADVAGSVNLTGSGIEQTRQASDWDLEYFTGAQTIGVAQTFNSKRLLAYNNVLATVYDFEENASCYVNVNYGSDDCPIILGSDLSVRAVPLDISLGAYALSNHTPSATGNSPVPAGPANGQLWLGGGGWGTAGRPRAIELSKTDNTDFTPNSVSVRFITYRPVAGHTGTPSADVFEIIGFDGSGAQVASIKYDAVYDKDTISINFANPASSVFTRNNGTYNTAPTLTVSGSFATVRKLQFKVNANYVGIDDLSIGAAVSNTAPTATNLTQNLSFTEDPGSPVTINDIVVTDNDAGETITATLTLSNASAGSLTTGTFGAATSIFNAGVWSVSGSVANVNAALAAVAFVPASNWDQNFTIATRIRDAAGAGPADGTISFTVTAVNDAPTATNLTHTINYTEDPGSPVDLNNIVVTDPDTGDTITATLTLSNASAGSLTTGTFGTATSTFNAGVWSVSGSVADVNAALAAVAFSSAANWDQDFTITTRIRDAADTGPADGSISLNVTPVNDAPTDISLSANVILQSATLAGAAVGTLSSTDVDSDSFIYSLVATDGTCTVNTGNASFQITGNKLQTAAALAAGTYPVCIQTSDGAAGFKKAFTITVTDDVAPAISSVNVPADAWYIAGQTLSFTVNTTENVTVTGTPTLPLTIGDEARSASYIGDSGATALIFSYTIQAGDNDSNGIVIGDAISAAGGTLRDAAGNDLTLTLSSVGSTAGVRIDTAAPALQSLSPADGSTNVAPGDNFVMTFSEDIALGSGNIVIYDALNNPVSTIDVSASEGQLSISNNVLTINPAEDLSENSSYYIQIPGGAVRDVAGLAYAGIADNTSWNFTTADLSPPAVTAIAISGAPAANAAKMEFSVTFNEQTHNVSADDFRVTQASGNATGEITDITAAEGHSYIVTIDNITGTGALRLDLNNKTDIIDNYGNGSGTNGHVAAFAEGAVHTVDRDAPLAPTLILSAAFDTGISSSDGITNVTTPVFTGTAEVGSTVTVTSSVNGLLGSTSTDGKGVWSFTPGAALDSNTTHSVSATAKDAAGNESVTSDALTVTIDTTVPYATDIRPHVNAEAGDASVVFSIEFNEAVFGLTANSFSVVTLDGSAAGTVSSVVAAEGGFDVTVDDISGAGQLRLDVNAGEGTDVAGNLLQAYTAGSAHPVDRVAPGLTGVSFEHGSVNTGNQSSISIVLSGAEIGTTANYTISSSAGGTPVTGTGSITDANQQIAGINVSSLPDGTLTVSVTLTDAAGNVTPTPVSATVEKDTVTPSVTSVEIADGDLREGDVITVSITLSEDVTVSGTSSTLAIDIGGDIRQATFVSENNGVLTYQYTVQAGDNTDADGVRIATSPGSLSLNGDTVADGAGNEADLGFAAVYNPDAQVDTEVPATPTIAVLAPADDTGVSDSDNITSVAQPTLSGTAEPDSAITIYSDVDGVVGNPTADGAGNWSLTLPVALSDNTHQITVVATDAAGNDSLASDPLTLVIDTTDPVITSVSFDQAVVDGTNYQNLSVTLAGAEVGTVVHYTITSDGGAGELTGSVTVTDAGQSITGLNVSSLPDGTLSISVKLVDTAGNESTAVTDAISKNVNPVLALPVNPAPIVDGSDAALPGVVISGTASASIVVELSVGADEGILTLEAQGATLTGNGSGNVTVTGTLTQVNDTLATLEYTAPENFTTASSSAVSVLIEVDDGVGTVADQIDIDVYDRPDIENLQDNTVSLIRGSSNKVAIDAGGNATVSDLDNPHFNGGSLRVTISAGGNPAQDLLSFLNDGAVTLDPDTALANSDVQVDDGTSVAVIGVLAHDISEGHDLVINLNANATPARVELALQSLAFSNSAAGATLGARTLSIELFDGSYADAIRVVTTSVSVQDAPAEGGNNVIDDNQSDVTVIGTVTVTENGVLNGGTITGTITNRGIVTGNVTLGANSFINGGTVSGNINGNAGQPARINDAIITSEASLSNVIIGVGTVLEPGVTIGENVRFESEASIPAGLDLSAALRTLNWSSGDARGVVMLDGNVFAEGSADDDMTILRAIQLLGDYEPAGNDVEQDSQTGEILVVTSDFNAAVLPVQVSKAGPDEIPGTYINDNGDIVFVTVNQRVVLSYPVLASKPAFLAMLQSAGLQLHYDERANMQVYNPSVTVIGDRDVQAVTGEGGEYYYSARPDVLSLPAHRSQTPGLVEYPLAGLGSPTGLSLVFEEGGELREQDLVPASPDWFSLKDALLAIDGISAVSIDTQGILSVTLDGQTLKARLEYVVFIGRETARDNILIRDVGDKTGNGRTDYEIVYTNGDVQYLYVY